MTVEERYQELEAKYAIAINGLRNIALEWLTNKDAYAWAVLRDCKEVEGPYVRRPKGRRPQVFGGHEELIKMVACLPKGGK